LLRVAARCCALLRVAARCCVSIPSVRIPLVVRRALARAMRLTHLLPPLLSPSYFLLDIFQRCCTHITSQALT
jgi:hypothetical protein